MDLKLWPWMDLDLGPGRISTRDRIDLNLGAGWPGWMWTKEFGDLAPSMDFNLASGWISIWALEAMDEVQFGAWIPVWLCFDFNLDDGSQSWALSGFHLGAGMNLNLDPAWISTWTLNGSQFGPWIDLNL